MYSTNQLLDGKERKKCHCLVFCSPGSLGEGVVLRRGWSEESAPAGVKYGRARTKERDGIGVKQVMTVMSLGLYLRGLEGCH